MISRILSLFAARNRGCSVSGPPRFNLSLVLALPLLVGTSSLARAASPLTGGVTPQNASSLVSVAKTIAAVYSDADGATDITEARLLVKTTSSNSASSLCGVYNRATNKLYMYADDGTTLTPTGGYAPGSANTITNSQGTLNCAATTVSVSGNNLTIGWNFTPNSSYTGSQNLYEMVTDSTSATTGYVDRGDWVISSANVAPTLGTVTPSPTSSLINVAKSLTAVYSDANGVGDISQAQLLVSASAASTANTLCGVYLHSNNKLYLFADNGTTLIGAYTPGSANTITNSQGTLNCAATTVTESGNNLTVNWNFTPNSTYTGAKNTYGLAFDVASSRIGYVDLGDWTISLPNVAPTNGTVSPNPISSNMGSATAITATYSDGNGASDLSTVYFLANTTASGASALYASYDAVNNKLYLRDDADSAWLGGFAPGSANTITNSQGTLNCASISVSSSGNTLTVNWNMTPTDFAGDVNVWLKAVDLFSGQVIFEDRGDWTIIGLTLIGTYDGTDVDISYDDNASLHMSTQGDGVVHLGLPAGKPLAIVMATDASCTGASPGGSAYSLRTVHSYKTTNWVWVPNGSQVVPSLQPSYGFPMLVSSNSAVGVSGDPSTHASTNVLCYGTVVQDDLQLTPDVGDGTDTGDLTSSQNVTFDGTPNSANKQRSPVYNTAPRVQGSFVSALTLRLEADMFTNASGTNWASASVSVNAGMADVLLDWEF